MTIKTLIKQYEKALLEKDEQLQLEKLKKLRNDLLLFIASGEIKATEREKGIDLLTRLAFSIN